MNLFSQFFISLFVILAAMMPLTSVADALDEISARGQLIVGVQNDVPSFAAPDPETGEIVGLEPDLAKDLANRLGVALKMVPVVLEDRGTALQERRVDVIIAALSETPERREQLTLVTPSYYESGAGLLTRRADAFTDWSELRNRRICSRRGAFYNRPIAVQYGADIVALYSAYIALAALRDGRCDGFLEDSIVFTSMLQADAALAERYEMILPPLFLTGWAVALRYEERGGRLEALISETIKNWHRTGFIGQLEDRWGIPRSSFTRRMEEKFANQSMGVIDELTNELEIGDPFIATQPPLGTHYLSQDIARIIESGELVVAISGIDTPPFFFERDGELVGLEVEMAKALAKALDVSVRFNRQAQSFDEVIDIIVRQEADIGISKLSRTLSRARKVRFSQPYLTLNHALAINRAAFADIATDDSIERVVHHFNGAIGVIEHSSFAYFAQHNFPDAEIRAYPRWSDVVQALMNGEVIAAYYDEFAVQQLLQSDLTTSLNLYTFTFVDQQDTLGIAVGANDTMLLDFVNIFLEKYHQPLTIDILLEAIEY